MTTTQKLLIAGGVFTVVIIIAVAAFSLGVTWESTAGQRGHRP